MAQNVGLNQCPPHWLTSRQPVTVAVQLQNAITLGLTSAHGPPMNISNYNYIEAAWRLYWKW
eukprot:2067601-Heterocapsa_arctica.AAC.1